MDDLKLQSKYIELCRSIRLENDRLYKGGFQAMRKNYDEGYNDGRRALAQELLIEIINK